MWYNIHILKYLWDKIFKTEVRKRSTKTMVILWDKANEKIGCGHIVSFVNYQDSQT